MRFFIACAFYISDMVRNSSHPERVPSIPAIEAAGTYSCTTYCELFFCDPHCKSTS